MYKAAAALPSKPAASSSAGGRTANRNASGGRSSSGRGANGSNNPRKGGGGGGRSGTNASGGKGGGRGNNSNNNNNNNQGGGGRGRGNSGRGRGNNNNNNSGGRGSNPNNNARRESYNNKSSPQHQQDSQQQQQQQQQQQDNVPRTPWEEIVLLHSTGMGNGEAEKSVVRCSVTSLMTCRLDCLDAPSEPSDQTGDSDMVWTPISRCVWTSDADRRRTIQADMNVLWNYKPLEIDHEKRWKKPVDEEGEALRRAVGILNKLSWTTLEKLTLSFLEAIGLANLLQQAATTDNGSNANNSTSPSNKDSTSPAAVSLDKKLVEDSMALILDKAMSEPHFAELYAHFSAKLFSVHKTFRRSLLGLCEAQFKNTDNATTTNNSKSNDGGDSSTPNSEEGKEDAATVEAKTDEADKEEPTMDAATAEYNAALAKKKYLGLVQFIGELYKLSVIKPKIVVFCLQELFVKADEEKLECFAKLMTTIGEKLDKEDSIREDLAHVWDDVYSMAGRPTQNTTNGPKAPSNRIKFLLQDLSDLRQGGWVESQRRQESKAKTIAQIHEEVALEEKQQKQQQQKPNKTRMIRSQSAGTSLNSRSSITSTSGSGSTSTLDVDADGFQKVQSLKPPKKTGLRRVQSDVAATVKSNAPTSSLERALAATVTGAPSSTTTPSPPAASSLNGQDEKASNTASKEDGATKQYLSPDECEKKMENILKEYFVGGDTADAVLSVDELVGASSSSTTSTDADVVARGEAVVRAGILLVLERKHDDVSKFLTVLKHCLVPESRPPIVPWSCLALGLCLPLELLRDVEIDAPLAPKHLAQIVVEWMRLPPGNDASPTTTTTTTGGLDLAQLLLQQAPDYFRSDGRPAQFAKQVLQSYYHEKTSADISDDHVQLVSQLLSEDERWEHSNVREWILSS